MLTADCKKFKSLLPQQQLVICNSLWLVIGSAVFFTVFLNLAFFRKAYQALGMTIASDYLLFGSFVIFIFCFINILFSLFLVSYLKKPLLVILLCCSAFGSYVSLFYGVYIDDEMLVNVFQTDIGEATSLINIKLIIWLIIFGLIPSIMVIFYIRIKRQPIIKATLQRVANIIISIIVLLAMYFPLAGGYSFFLKTHKSALKLITPANYIYALGDHIHQSYKTEIPFQHIAIDAIRQPITINGKKQLIIILVGETSRAKNFSLNGYKRDTNPLLAKQQNLFNFQHATSCGTSTAVSVPCMFSNMQRKKFDRNLANNQDNLLDIIARAGVNVLWKDNDSNCKEVCNRVPTEKINKVEPPELCPAGLCYDILLLNNLDKYITQRTDDTVIILHTNGSHGPTYYQRYQTAQEKFTPTCKTSQVDSCSQQELINVYDNTIVNVDYVLNGTIELLKKHSEQFSTAMLYMSDHGESLGENGFYLHGAPYSIAPKEQTHIPMIFWLSDNFLTSHQLNQQCLLDKAKNDTTVSHDNLFHTVLGSLGVKTKEYNPQLDLFNNCKNT